MANPAELKRVDQLVVDDMVDLEGDKHADPDRDHPEYEAHYVVVQETERETENCILVHFDIVSVGFPPDHKVKVKFPMSKKA